MNRHGLNDLLGYGGVFVSEISIFIVELVFVSPKKKLSLLVMISKKIKVFQHRP